MTNPGLCEDHRLGQRLLGLADPSVPLALGLIAELGIADLVAGGTEETDELAKASGTDPRALRRVLSVLSSRGVFTELSGDRWALNPTADLLRADHPLSLRHVISVFPWNVRALARFLDTIRTGVPSFDAEHGQNLWQYLADNPTEGRRFDRTMAALSSIELPGLAAGYPWDRYRVIVDVGGGNGEFLAGLLRCHGRLSGVLFDLPEVVGDAGSGFSEAGLLGRIEIVGGDFFQWVPPGGDLYVLKRILYSWSEDRAMAILSTTRAAMSEDSRLLIVEPVLRRGHRQDAGGLLDLQMMMLGSGGMRDRGQLKALVAPHGLKVTRIVPTPISSIVECRVVHADTPDPRSRDRRRATP